MWIFLNNAYLSIVRDRDQPNYLLVRARNEGDIEAIFPAADVIKGAGTDYLFRTVIHESLVATAIKYAILDINYGNFKDSIPATSPKYHDACLNVWVTMHSYQQDGVRNAKA
jgi:hypothetical protein